MSDSVLHVQMFGGFQVFYGDEVIISRNARNSKAVQLLAYLLKNRGKMVYQDELVNILLSDEIDINPYNTLKNIVYRARKLLSASGATEEFVRYKNGAYGFGADIPCEIDAERFLELARLLDRGSLKENERYAHLLEMLRLYRGDYLLAVSEEPWVISAAVNFQDIYMRFLEQAYSLSAQRNDLSAVVDYLYKATTLFPYEEDIHEMYISALYDLGRAKEAISHYEFAVNLLFDELGISPSEDMRALYRKITGGLKSVADSVVEVRNRIIETGREKGAYFCNFEAFSEIYHFAVRHIERSGQTAFLMLCSITELDGQQPPTGERLAKIMATLQKALRIACRRGDVCARYSASQYIVILMDIKQENCQIVSDRLRFQFYRLHKSNDVRLDNKVVSAVDVDSVMSGGNRDEITIA